MTDATPWPLFEVSVEGYGTSVLAARSHGAAVYSRFLDFTDVWDCSFRDFLDRVRVCRIPPAQAPDPYGYVRRYYGCDIRHGTRVTITGEGRDLEGRAGTVIHPGRNTTAYAHVVLDGDRYAINVHPKSVVLI